MQCADGIHLVEGVSGANVYVITGARPTIVDTGIPGQSERILSYLAHIGLPPANVQTILLTHHDIDHIGSAEALRRATGATVWVPEGDAPYILGELPRHGMKRYLPRLLRPLVGALQPVQIDRRLADGDEVPGGFVVLSTPGHTPGHICLYRPGVLVAGDLLSTRAGGPLRTSPRAMNWDVDALRASIRKVAELPCDVILAGHGSPVLQGGGPLLQRLARSLPAR